MDRSSIAERGGRSDRIVSDPTRDTALRVERLLGEIESTAGPATWGKVEELVRALLELQREGLARVLSLVSADAHGSATLSALADDELVSSLLLLHGLHPVPAAERIRRALDELEPHLEPHSARVDLVEVGDGGTIRLRISGVAGCVGSAVEHAVRRAIGDAAPEVARLDIEMPGETHPPHGLVQLKLKKPEQRA